MRRFLNQWVVCAWVISMSGTPALTQVPAELIPSPPGYTLAELATVQATDGKMARVIDGAAAGSLIFWDGSTSRWRCYSELSGILKPTCPPYNANPEATDGTNHAALQAVLDRMKEWTTGGPFRCIELGHETLTINSGLEFDPAPDTSTVFCMYSAGNGTLKFTEDGAAYGLRIGGTNVGNQIYMNGVRVIGGGSNTGPEILVWLDHQVQVYMDQVKIHDPSAIGIAVDGGGHFAFVNGLCTENVLHDVNGSCIFIDGEVSDVRIVGNAAEGLDNSRLSWVRLGVNASVNVFNFLGNSHRGNGWFSMVQCATSNCKMKVAALVGNVAMELQDSGFDLGGLNSNESTDITIAGNVLNGCEDRCGTTARGIRIHDARRTVVSNNVIRTFPTGMEFDGVSNGLAVSHNLFEAINDYCIDIGGLYANVDIDTFMCDGASTADFKADGISKGNNSLRNVIATDESPPKFDLNGWKHITDSIAYAAKVQTETCADNRVAGAPQTLTLNPYYQLVKVMNADPDRCDITVGESNGTNGARFTLIVVADGGGSVDLADIPGRSELAGRFSGGLWDSITMEYTGATTPDRWVETSRSDN